MAAFESKKFSWRSGYSYRVSADTVGRALEDIERKDGEVTAASFLEYSRPEGADTHSMFEWDDTVAAEKYRHRQAQQIINQLEVRFEYVEAGQDESETEIRIVSSSAYLNVNRKAPTERAVFVNAVEAMSDAEKRKTVLMNAFSELDAFGRKYSQYNELGKVFDAVVEAKQEFLEVI